MNYFLIDYENVHNFESLCEAVWKKGDLIYIFYSSNANNISLDTLNRLNKQNVNYEVIEIFKEKNNYKNALDFQLVSYLGYIIGDKKDKQNNYYIVSKDNGFNNIVDFWKERGYQIESLKSGDNINSKNENYKEIENKLSEIGMNSNQRKDCVKIFKESISLSELNNKLAKYFKDSKKSSKVYKILKPLKSNYLNNIDDEDKNLIKILKEDLDDDNSIKECISIFKEAKSNKNTNGINYLNYLHNMLFNLFQNREISNKIYKKLKNV